MAQNIAHGTAVTMSLILNLPFLERLIGRPFHRLAVLRFILRFRVLLVLTTGNEGNSFDLWHGLKCEGVDADFAAFTCEEVGAAFVAEL